ncbi:MAG: amidohydrolase family protein [Oligoflexales bacterium]|nr:amidohydrolase family protein [Oligoflexales bacterium]
MLTLDQLNNKTLNSERRLILQNAKLIQSSGVEIQNACIAIENENIIYAGKAEDFKQNKNDYFAIDVSGYVITAGMINSHTHSPMTFFRGQTRGKAAMIEKVFFPLEKSLTPDLIEPLSYPYLYDALRSGVTCVADHYYMVDGVGRAAEKFGMRAVIGETLADLGGAFPDTKGLDKALAAIDAWPFSSLITPLLAPHAADTVSEIYLKKICQAARSRKLPVHMHLSQTSAEYEEVKKRSGLSPVEYAVKCGIEGPLALVVHLVSATATDFKLLDKNGITVVLCPSSQVQYERLAPIKELFATNVPISIANDCAGSNDSANLLQELKIAALFFKDRLEEYSEKISAASMLKMATLIPARALGLSQLGEIETGKLADLVFWQEDLGVLPNTNLIENLIYSFSSRQVKHVMINGRWVLWNQKLCQQSESVLVAQFQRAMGKLKLN